MLPCARALGVAKGREATAELDHVKGVDPCGIHAVAVMVSQHVREDLVIYTVLAGDEIHRHTTMATSQRQTQEIRRLGCPEASMQHPYSPDLNQARATHKGNLLEAAMCNRGAVVR